MPRPLPTLFAENDASVPAVALHSCFEFFSPYQHLARETAPGPLTVTRAVSIGIFQSLPVALIKNSVDEFDCLLTTPARWYLSV